MMKGTRKSILEIQGQIADEIVSRNRKKLRQFQKLLSYLAGKTFHCVATELIQNAMNVKTGAMFKLSQILE